MALLGSLTHTTLDGLRSGCGVDVEVWRLPLAEQKPRAARTDFAFAPPASSPPSPILVVQLEARVKALCALLQQAAARLCPAAAVPATDAALQLVSGLQAARLRLGDASPPQAAAVLERCTQELLGVLQVGLAPPTPALPPAPLPHGPPAAAASRPRASSDSRRSAELASLVQGLGYSARDWQAAQSHLAQRTALALQGLDCSSSGSGGRCGPISLPLPAAPSGDVAPPSPLESLLLACVSTPSWQPGSGEPSVLQAAARELLWLLRRLPPPSQLGPQEQLQLSPEGWAAYWMLEPRVSAGAGASAGSVALLLSQLCMSFLWFQELASHRSLRCCARTDRPAPAHAAMQALQQALAEILQAASAAPPDQQLLRRHPHWAATAAAAARHPALHLVMRQTLHGWFAASGNPAVWLLLLLYVRAAADGSGQSPQGELPAQLRALYPAALLPAAARLHGEQPSEAGLAEAVAQLQAFLAAPATEDEAPALEAAREPATAEEGAAAAARHQHAWRLQLDAPAWLLFCLRQLPLQQLLGAAAAQELAAAGPHTAAPLELGSLGSDGEEGGPVAAPSGSAAASPAAAAYAAMALWPGERERQAVVREALQGQLGDVDLPALRPWLRTLQAWQRMLLEAEACHA